MANPLSALPLPKFQKPLPSNPQTLADIQHVLKCGYIILHNQFSPSDAAAARAEIARLSGSTPQNGRNPFEGLKTNRIYSLFNKTRFFDKYTILPRVLALNDYFLDPGFNISSFHTIVIKPGEKPQPLHFDDQFCHIPRPRVPLGTAIIVAFDDFTEKNGATRVVPGSHLWGGERVPTFEESIPAGCPEGSVIFFVSTMWHGGGPNETEQGRQSLTVQYCQPYVRAPSPSPSQERKEKEEGILK